MGYTAESTDAYKWWDAVGAIEVGCHYVLRSTVSPARWVRADHAQCQTQDKADMLPLQVVENAILSSLNIEAQEEEGAPFL